MRRVAVRTLESAPATTPASGEFQVGQQVMHTKFGRGEIRSVSTASTDTLLDIDFGANGRKKLLTAYARKSLTILK